MPNDTKEMKDQINEEKEKLANKKNLSQEDYERLMTSDDD